MLHAPTALLALCLALAACAADAPTVQLPARALATAGTEVAADTARRGMQAALPPAEGGAALAAPRRVVRADTDSVAVPRLAVLPDGFAHLRDVAPEIAVEMRYLTAFNFVGAPIDGYRAETCILTERAALALARVADDLAAQNLGLKVYDCYRPQAAVDHFVRWARSGDQTMKRGFYPTEATTTLFRRGYIATRSGHTRGSTVDLTLVARPAAASVVRRYPTPADGPLPRCDRDASGTAGGTSDARFDDGDLDMGTAYDCLSPRAATAARGIPAAARRNRETLRAAMARRGFVNYSKEWWHYTLRDEPFPRTYHTFAVE